MDALEKAPMAVAHCMTEWSGPCQQMSMVLKELESMHPHITFLTVDIEKDTSVQKTYNIQAVPHVLFFKQGKLTGQVEGADTMTVVKTLETLMPSISKNTEQPSLNDQIEKLIASADVMLFMKGNPAAPRCGFSSKVVSALQSEHITFSTFDILQDESIRQGLKSYSQWPTYPQLYAGKEFMGGCDIILELKESGKLRQEIEQMKGNGGVHL